MNQIPSTKSLNIDSLTKIRSLLEHTPSKDQATVINTPSLTDQLLKKRISLGCKQQLRCVYNRRI